MLTRSIYILGFLLLLIGAATCHQATAQPQEQKPFIVGNPLLVAY